jgi:hypothetical protein
MIRGACAPVACAISKTISDPSPPAAAKHQLETSSGRERQERRFVQLFTHLSHAPERFREWSSINSQVRQVYSTAYSTMLDLA